MGGSTRTSLARLWRRGPVSARIPRSRDGRRAACDDDELVDELVLDVALLVLALSLPVWLALSLAIVLGRVRYERSHREVRSATLSERAARRLVRRVSGDPRTEWGRWRRVTALKRLEQAHHPAVQRLIRRVLVDADPKIAAAAIRTLGDIGDEWAIDLLLDALRRGNGQRSRDRIRARAARPGARPEAPPSCCVTGTRSSGSGARRCCGRTQISVRPRSSSSRGTPTRTSVPPPSRHWGREAAKTWAWHSSRDSTTASGSFASMPPAPPATCSGRRPLRRSHATWRKSGGGSRTAAEDALRGNGLRRRSVAPRGPRT